MEEERWEKVDGDVKTEEGPSASISAELQDCGCGDWNDKRKGANDAGKIFEAGPSAFLLL